MSDIQFDEPQMHYRSRTILGEPKTPAVVSFLVNKKWARDEEHATKILVFVIVTVLIISVFLLISTLSGQTANVYYSGSEQ